MEWQLWFAELQETHTSLPFLNFFRSPEPDRSWITAAGAVLDAAAMVNSTIDAAEPADGEPVRPVRATPRSGRSPASSGCRTPTDPAPDDPISIGRDEWEDACRELEAVGVPLMADRDQAWRDFAGWRVNYDVPLVMLAGLLVAPYAPWSSDRSIPFKVRIIRREDRPGRASS